MISEEARFPENLPPEWREHLASEVGKPYFRQLALFLKQEYASGQEIYPPRDLILRALQGVDYEEVRIVMLGQDPYHGPGQAMGLAFAVPNEFRPKPPSLGNIFKELQSDLGHTVPGGVSDLTGWADQGVLLLNTVLTVRRGQAFSHRKKGWETFTDHVIQRLNERERPMVFILWGASAISKKKFITHDRHRIIESVHPSPLSASRGFFGSRPFSRANAFLSEIGSLEVDWLRISGQRQRAAS